MAERPLFAALHSTLFFTVHFVLRILQCALCTVYSTLGTKHCAMCAVHCVFYSVHYALCTVHCALYAALCILCTQVNHKMPDAVSSIEGTVLVTGQDRQGFCWF